MDKDKIKDKIKKLLALSNDSTYDAESYAALQKAQELMVEYKLSEKDIVLEDTKDRKCIKKKTLSHYGTRSSDTFLVDLASVISENFCCVDYISRPLGSRTHYICFMGYEEDVEIATEALYKAESDIKRGYNRVYRMIAEEYGLDYVPANIFNPKKLGYTKGYIDGLKEAFKSQKEEHQEWGLVLVVPEEAQSYIDSLDVFNTSNHNWTSNTFYSEGYEDGKNFHLNDKLSSGTNIEALNE